MKIVFLNDLHPQSIPGAASIAYSLAEEASKKYQVEFWCTEITGVSLPHNPQIKVRVRRVSRTRAQKMEGGLLQRFYFELVGIRELLWVITGIVRFRPTHIWLHQIGNRFPKSIIPTSRILGVFTLATLHDFGMLLGRKLYPKDLGWSIESVDSHIHHVRFEDQRIVQGYKPRDTLLRIRREFVKLLLNCSSSTVCISELQDKILKSSGLKKSIVIPNGVEKCKCAVKPRLVKGRFDVLFAGRPNAKGLELLAQAVSEKPDSHLHLAGPYRLGEIAAIYLDSNQYTYHGNLSRLQIYELIHQVDLVSVISQCFDVYPTITLEALAHGTPVLTTPLTGNFDLVKSLSHELVLQVSQKPELNAIASAIKHNRMHFPEISTVSDSWDLYEKILIQTS